jgi:hypothetical protein
MNSRDAHRPEDKQESLRILTKRNLDPLSGVMMPKLRQAHPGFDTWKPVPVLPSFTVAGFLPEGVHDATLEAIRSHFVTSAKREKLWGQLTEFLTWPTSTGHFPNAYLGGGFISQKPDPQDIDLVLHVRYPFGDKAFMAIEPFFARGLDTILESYSVHLHFWVDGFPGRYDFRSFFQYVTPREAMSHRLSPGARKGMVKLNLLVDSDPQSALGAAETNDGDHLDAQPLSRPHSS